MKKRIKKKINDREKIKFMIKLDIFKELKEDSVAHKIKDYFTLGTIENKMMFEWDNEHKYLLVSKKSLMYILTLCNSAERIKNYNMKLVKDNKWERGEIK